MCHLAKRVEKVITNGVVCVKCHDVDWQQLPDAVNISYYVCFESDYAYNMFWFHIRTTIVATTCMCVCANI